MIEKPQSLSDIPAFSADALSFGMSVRDFLGVFYLRKRRGEDIALMLSGEPAIMAGTMIDGDVNDAFLGGMAEYLSRTNNFTPPMWSMSPSRKLIYRWYPVEIEELKKHLDVVALPEFKWRNIYIDSSAFQRL